jgi:1,4-dihydroxy-2-naphthoyl-CoA synthase
MRRREGGLQCVPVARRGFATTISIAISIHAPPFDRAAKPFEDSMSEQATADRPGQLTHHKVGHVGYVVFDNQRKFNAVNFDMWSAVPKVIAGFVADPEVRVIVIKGAGEKAFISGADISQFDKQRTGSANDDYNAAVDAGYSAVLDCPKPTVASIRGICMGGGLGLAVNCDIRICSDDAKFRMPAARLGLGYQYPGLKRFTEVLGPANTADLFFSARIFGAADAKDMGFVKQIVPAAELDAVVTAYTTQIAENAPLTVAAAKRALLEIRKDADKRDVDLVNRMVQACFASEDYNEGRKAFAEKRTPNFTGK